MRANYKVELASGIFLLLGILAMIWLATRATNYGQEIGKDSYEISARFGNVAELKDRAPVKIGGVMVGMVEAVELDPVTFEAVVTCASIPGLTKSPMTPARPYSPAAYWGIATSAWNLAALSRSLKMAMSCLSPSQRSCWSS